MRSAVLAAAFAVGLASGAGAARGTPPSAKLEAALKQWDDAVDAALRDTQDPGKRENLRRGLQAYRHLMLSGKVRVEDREKVLTFAYQNSGLTGRDSAARIDEMYRLLKSGREVLYTVQPQWRAFDAAHPTKFDPSGRFSFGSGRPAGMPEDLKGKLYAALAATYPKDGPLHLKLAQYQQATGDWKSAFASSHQAIANGLASPAAFAARGLSAERLGDYRRANQDAAAALRLEPGNAIATSVYKLTEGRTSRVRLLDDEGRLASGQGRERAREASAEPPATAARARPETDAGSTSARPEFVSPKALQSQAYLREAGTLLKVGDSSAARERASQAIGADPEYASAYHVRAFAASRGRDFASAERDATRAIELGERDASIYDLRAYARNRLRRYADAKEDAALALDLDPRDADAYFNMAYAEAGLGRRDASLRALRSAAELKPGYRGALQSALDRPSHDDLLLLFSGVASEDRRAQEPGRKEGSSWLMLWWAASASLCGFSLVLAAFRIGRRALEDSNVEALRA
ncbi:MAG: hypothetical protein HY078_03130 [Elusimicrobia bacterium]|nr:hypothetical protein [Elusimicrobiota bacterium]